MKDFFKKMRALIDEAEAEETPSFENVQVGDTVLFSNGLQGIVSSLNGKEFLTNTIIVDNLRSNCWSKQDGKTTQLSLLHTRDDYPRVIRILPKLKPSNLTFMQACDLLDSGEAEEVTYPAVSKSVLIKYGDSYRWKNYRSDTHPTDNIYITQEDRLATDWYVVR